MNLEMLKFRCDISPEGHWEWRSDAKTGDRKRHPMAAVDGKPKLMRRHAYELVKGSLATGKYLAPTCGNKECINPAHQQTLTNVQKNKRGGMAAANSATRGPRVAQTRRAKGLAKINMDIANAIRQSESPAEEEAARYGIDPARVTQIRRGEGWKDYASPFAGLGARA